jgi:hypothetical protein
MDSTGEAPDGTPLRWHYGAAGAGADPGKMWCEDCGGEVSVFDGLYVCGCGRQENMDGSDREPEPEDLSAWLTARYDEAEARTNAVFGFWCTSAAGNIVDTSYSAYIAVGPNGKGIDKDSRAHILAYGPEWAIRDVALKRAILAGHRPDGLDSEYCRTCQHPEPGWASTAPAEAPCETVRHLGTEFSKHPDYREEWKPSTQ